jgi:hypothetical protein
MAATAGGHSAACRVEVRLAREQDRDSWAFANTVERSLPGYASTLVPMVAKMAERSADDDDPGPDETTDDRPGEAELSADVIAARCTADAHPEQIGAAIDAQIEVMLANCRIALDALVDQHAYLADHGDLDLDGGTRWTARWQLAAAAIVYANALVDLSARGYVDAALPVSRTLHEALGVLGVINDDAEQTILTRWLEDREVTPKKVRAAAERQAKRALEEAAAQCVDLAGTGVKQSMEQRTRCCRT